MSRFSIVLRCALVASAAAAASCTPSPHNAASTPAIPIEQEKVCLVLRDSEEALEGSPGWPEHDELRRGLLEHIRLAGADLEDELRRCQKYGLYTVVDSLHAPTVRVEVSLTSGGRSGDTLFLPVKVTVRRAGGSRIATGSFTAFGVSSPTPPSELHRLDQALADYRRRFPCGRIAAQFYRLAPSRTSESPAP